MGDDWWSSSRRNAIAKARCEKNAAKVPTTPYKCLFLATITDFVATFVASFVKNISDFQTNRLLVKPSD